MGYVETAAEASKRYEDRLRAEGATARTRAIVSRLREIAELRRQSSTLPNTHRGRSVLRVEAACIEDLARQIDFEFPPTTKEPTP